MRKTKTNRAARWQVIAINRTAGAAASRDVAVFLGSGQVHLGIWTETVPVGACSFAAASERRGVL